MAFEKIDRKMGVVLGAAVGDALGKATESISEEQLRHHFDGRVTKFEKPMPDHPCSHLEAHQYTDDTQQLVALAESLVERKGFDVHHFSQKLIEWGKLQKKPKHWRWPGMTSLKAVERLSKGVNPTESGSKTSESCGSVMRVAPVGVVFQNEQATAENARQSSKPTHASEACVEASAAAAVIVHHLVNGVEPVDAVRKALKCVKSEKIKKQLDKAIKLSNSEEQKAMHEIGTSGTAHETLGYAVYAFLHTPKNPRATLVTAANAVPGDTDSIACVAGAFTGAHNGLTRLPKEFVQQIEEREKLLTIARKLSEVKA